jgi:hypothetical protein
VDETFEPEFLAIMERLAREVDGTL